VSTAQSPRVRTSLPGAVTSQDGIIYRGGEGFDVTASRSDVAVTCRVYRPEAQG
jgi:hypothetical protein